MVEYDLMEGSWGSWGPLVCSKISQATRKNMRAASRRHLACWCNGSDAILADFWHGGTNFHTGIMNKKNKFAMMALGIWGFSCIDSQAYNDFPLVSLGCSLCPVRQESLGLTNHQHDDAVHLALHFQASPFLSVASYKRARLELYVKDCERQSAYFGCVVWSPTISPSTECEIYSVKLS